MAEYFDSPPFLTGDAERQIRELRSYLTDTMEKLNRALEGVGAEIRTYTETQIGALAQASGEKDPGGAADDVMQRAENLRSMIIKEADAVTSAMREVRLKLRGEYMATGAFGGYLENAENEITITPTGTEQTLSLKQEIQGIRDLLSKYEIEYHGYVKSGLLRVENNLPVYGIAIGKDVVSFTADGKMIYTDGNKAAELTESALSFYQGGSKLASFSGTRLSFYSGGTETVYITGEVAHFVQSEVDRGMRVADYVIKPEGRKLIIVKEALE